MPDLGHFFSTNTDDSALFLNPLRHAPYCEDYEVCNLLSTIHYYRKVCHTINLFSAVVIRCVLCVVVGLLAFFSRAREESRILNYLWVELKLKIKYFNGRSTPILTFASGWAEISLQSRVVTYRTNFCCGQPSIAAGIYEKTRSTKSSPSTVV